MSARLIVALVLAAALTAGAASGEKRSIDLRGPRPFGYLIGDVIRLEADIALDEAFALVPGSLPKARSVNYWLDLKSIAVNDHGVRGGQRRYRLLLEYQTFYAPLAPRQLVIPGFAFTVTDGSTQLEGNVPAWRFLMSPLRELTSSGTGEAVYLRADVQPERIPLARARAAALGSGIAALLLLGMLAHHRAWWPFKLQRKRPFARATRAVQQALAREPKTEEYLASLLSLHRAFDATAGRRVLAEDVRDFRQQNAAFRPLQADIERFFVASRHAFFSSDPIGAITALPPGSLVAIARRFAAAERAAS
jgi:mxaA protein